MAERRRAAAGRRPPERGRLRVHGDVQDARRPIFADVHALVRRIPRGRVMTYGQIATLLLNRVSPRAVGWAMHGCPDGVPWHRVVNASGGCSTERMPDIPPGLQQALLEAEGVVFRPNATIDLDAWRWSPAMEVTERPARPRAAGRRARGAAPLRPARRSRA